MVEPKVRGSIPDTHDALIWDFSAEGAEKCVYLTLSETKRELEAGARSRTRRHIPAQPDEGEAGGLLLSPPPQGRCTKSPLE